MAKIIPLSLYKRGLVTIEDNLLPGQEVSFHRMFGLIFRSELEARIFRPKKPSEGDPGEAPEPSN